MMTHSFESVQTVHLLKETPTNFTMFCPGGSLVWIVSQRGCMHMSRYDGANPGSPVWKSSLYDLPGLREIYNKYLRIPISKWESIRWFQLGDLLCLTLKVDRLSTISDLWSWRCLRPEDPPSLWVHRHYSIQPVARVRDPIFCLV
jgi:hypothetical protein